MSNHKHTPGTWEVSSFGDSVQIKKGKRQLHPLSVCLPIFERQANAQLIAAAPDMLEALIAERDWKTDKERARAADMRHAAITKATRKEDA